MVKYTYNSNTIEGNTLILRKTDMVLCGLTTDHVQATTRVPKSENPENPKGILCYWKHMLYGHTIQQGRKNHTSMHSSCVLVCTEEKKRVAYVDIAHSILIVIYHILKNWVAFKELGTDYYNQFDKERKINVYLKKLKILVWETPVVTA